MCRDGHAQQDSCSLCHLSSDPLKQVHTSLQVHVDGLGIAQRLLKSGLGEAVLLQLEKEKE